MRKIVYINIIIIALVCAIVAKIAANFISYRLSHSFSIKGNKTGPVSSTCAAEDLTFFSPILEKGFFGKSAQGSLTTVTVSNATRNPSASPTDLVLLGTVVGSFRETFALIRRISSNEEKVFRLGDKVFDLGKLASVRKEYVELLVDGKRIKIVTPVTPSEDTGPATASTPTASGVVRQVTTPGTYVVDQRALNSALDNIGQAMTDARLLPSMKEGKVEGFRISEVKPAGIFGMVGIKNGDILLRINDFSVDSPDKAIQSLASLKGQNRIKLDLVRDGQPATFNYEIR